MLAAEALIRVGAFVAVFAALALVEAVAHRHQRAYSRCRRWPSNLAVAVLNTGVVRIIFPATAVSLALICQEQGGALFNNLRLASWFAVAGTLVVMDLATHWQPCFFCRARYSPWRRRDVRPRSGELSGILWEQHWERRWLSRSRGISPLIVSQNVRGSERLWLLSRRQQQDRFPARLLGQALLSQASLLAGASGASLTLSWKLAVFPWVTSKRLTCVCRICTCTLS
jgi:hypothetical protein